MADEIRSGPPVLPAVANSEEFKKARRSLIETLSRRAGGVQITPSEAARSEFAREALAALAASPTQWPEAAQSQLLREAMDEFFGFGPIQPLLDDSSVTEVMVNRADRVYIERAGKPHRTTVTFDDDAHVMRIIERIIQPLGRRLDSNNPLVDARLPDGSRVNAVVPPVAIAGPCLTIRKFSKSKMGLDELCKVGAMTPAVSEFLKGCVLARMNVVVCGGTGSGKTTLLNALSGCIPDDERIVTIEDAAELKLVQDHVITLESKKANPDGSGEVSIRDLVRNALRMRPERIVVGECRGGETLDMLQAMNTGHDGSLTTLHANTPRDAIARIETMTLMAGIDLPIRAIREQIGSAIELLVQVARMRDGSRKITSITEIGGMEGERIVLQEIFKFKEVPTPIGSAVVGALMATGLRPRCVPKLEMMGIKLAPQLFIPGAAIPVRPAA
ncbi:MAG TPA: CpaF family protein [Tepidisphaeraceae bacterium]|jgi:pilus assembly protein CpaF|nr:CpaF family protein [Tepidisphaeraceae bacterium]